ncbi:MAG: FAD-dependent oxidoreductase [Chitinophagaceae bacterium]|nr:FAD-dependent oxidoreductase [Chitinophagaceae bacterium]
MIRSSGVPARSFPSLTLEAGLVVTGGGLSGVCCALTAARKGIRVILVQDRPVLGGNSSSEVRLWILGATSHMGNNNRWAREGGVVDEILVENTYRNPEGNPVVFDMVLLDKVMSEPRITLLLNTAVYEVIKTDEGLISSVKAYCSQNQTTYELVAPLFTDASGDGVVGFLAGAAFRMGAESTEEFGELFAPAADYGELLGHSLYFYTKDVGRPVRYIPPAFALDDITKIPRFRSFNTEDYGCRLWWIEYGGRLDTVHDTETIKWELWKVVYGVWNYIKNSGNFPDAETLTLEWVGMIPGKRESRRFEGDYILRQQDIVEQRSFEDAVAYGGWSIDLHPSDGVFSEKPGCNQWHSKGIYSIPYRSLYSRNVPNLLFSGRLISATHVAFGSSRVMGTGAYIGQASGMAAVLCRRHGVLPRDLLQRALMAELQQELLWSGQHIPGLVLQDEKDLTRRAEITVSSKLVLDELPQSVDLWRELYLSAAQMLPLSPGECPEIRIYVDVLQTTELATELKVSGKSGNFTPDRSLGKKNFTVSPGRHEIVLSFDVEIVDECYGFFCLYKNPLIKVAYSARRITGILSVFNLVNEAVSNYGLQTPPEGIGMETFEFWCPQRRPEGLNLAMKISSGLDVFDGANIRNGLARPTVRPNAWVADPGDPVPAIRLTWKELQRIRRVIIKFDTDADHPMESVLMTHPETVMPFCVRNFIIYDCEGRVLYRETGNYQTIRTIEFPEAVITQQLTITVEHPSGDTPAAIFEILCYP